jgi:hypothetical protein
VRSVGPEVDEVVLGGPSGTPALNKVVVTVVWVEYWIF